MRRVVSFLAGRRSDKASSDPPSDGGADPRHPTRSKSRSSHLNVSTAPLHNNSSLTSASSISSTGSVSLRTPDDNDMRTADRRSWVPWTAGKKAFTLAGRGTLRMNTTSAADWESASQGWMQPGHPMLPPPVVVDHPESDTDASSESGAEDGDDDGDADGAAAPKPGTAIRARDFLTRTTLISLSSHPSMSSSPLYTSPASHSFPRSCNSARSLRMCRDRAQDLAVRMHKHRLLRRLYDVGRPLQPFEEQEIAPLAARPRGHLPVIEHNVPAAEGVLPHLDPSNGSEVEVRPGPGRVHEHSLSLLRWIERPCFEDRVSVFLPTSNVVGAAWVAQRVAGSTFGVAALEYSETVELLAGLLGEHDHGGRLEQAQEQRTAPFDATSLLLDADAVRNVGTDVADASRLPQGAGVQGTAQPRLKHTVSITPPLEGSMPCTSPMPSPVSPSKRGVRFASSNDEASNESRDNERYRDRAGDKQGDTGRDAREDSIPLAYVLRNRKNKEEKARFLRQEAEKRRAEDEERRAREQVILRERERELEREREREREKERERRAAEEERRQRLYKEEVAASRMRREMERAGRPPAAIVAGGSPSPGASPGSSAPGTPALEGRERSRTQERDSIWDGENASGRGSVRGEWGGGGGSGGDRERYSRPAYDNHSQSGTARRKGGSDIPKGAGDVSSVRHSRLLDSPSPSRPASVLGGGSSHRGSVYTSSSEDVRWDSTSSRGRAQRAQGNNPYFARAWGSGAEGFDAPLLPPAPPFVTQEYGYRRSRMDSQGSGTGSSVRHGSRSATPSPSSSSSRLGPPSPSSHSHSHSPGRDSSSDHQRRSRPSQEPSSLWSGAGPSSRPDLPRHWSADAASVRSNRSGERRVVSYHSGPPSPHPHPNPHPQSHSYSHSHSPSPTSPSSYHLPHPQQPQGWNHLAPPMYPSFMSPVAVPMPMAVPVAVPVPVHVPVQMTAAGFVVNRPGMAGRRQTMIT